MPSPGVLNRDRTGRRPRVSIAIPVYNGARWIGDTVRSALAQTFDDFEVVVVDNASTDATVETISVIGDDRVRLFRNPTNLGPYRNMNRTVEESRGELIKFLHADDELLPNCLERMVERFDDPDIGLVFAPRRIELSNPGDPKQQQWLEDFGRPERRFGVLRDKNDGRALLRAYLSTRGSYGNWIGEPSSVMVRRACLERVGGFSLRVRQLNDMDLWALIMAFYDVSFVDEELSVYRFDGGSGGGNLTSRNNERRRGWLDPLWMLEGLRRHPEIQAAIPELDDYIKDLRRRTVRSAVGAVRRRPSLGPERLRDYASYAAYRATPASRRPALHPRIAAVPSAA